MDNSKHGAPVFLGKENVVDIVIILDHGVLLLEPVASVLRDHDCMWHHWGNGIVKESDRRHFSGWFKVIFPFG